MIDILTGYVIFLFIISVHEFSHAWMADRCGDPTARLQGRMTLDPRPHMDMVGTVLIPFSPLILSLIGGGGFFHGFRFFGWARPVPVNPLNVRRWRRDNTLISLAGPASGFLLALLAAALFRFFSVMPFSPLAAAGFTRLLLFRMGVIAVWLSIFNLVPVPPLDGYHILAEILRIDPGRSAAFMRTVGPLLILIIINLPLFYMVLGPINELLFAYLFSAVSGV